MPVPKKRRRKLPAPGHVLVADIRTNKFSYYISSHRSADGSERVSDEAIIEIQAQISEIEPVQIDHIGKQLDCSLVCSRNFSRDRARTTEGHPTLFSVMLRRDGRSFLAYLPADAFWAIQVALDAGTIKRIEASYAKPFRGSGDLTSLHLS